MTYVILSVKHSIRSTEQSSVCRKLRQPGCVSLVATVNLDLKSSDHVETVDRSCSKCDADRDTRVEGKPNGNNDSKEHSECKWPEDTQKSTGDFDRYTTIMAALSKESSETTTKIEATLVRAVKYETVSRSRPSYRLVGLVVRRPPRERKIPGSNPARDVDFFRGRVKKLLCLHNTDCMLLCSTLGLYIICTCHIIILLTFPFSEPTSVKNTLTFICEPQWHFNLYQQMSAVTR